MDIMINEPIIWPPKYIDPTTDFGFKRIFKDEEITRGFLNDLVQSRNPDVHIASVTITDGEADEANKDIRRVVYDVNCVTQMPLYRKMKESDCETVIDKWIYNLSNMPKMKTQLAFKQDKPLFMRLEKLASYSDMTRE
nr:Rpn family recombination-promoting nuclease/putative transposase [Bacteroidales bacterium]